MPFALYRRLRLVELMTWFALPKPDAYRYAGLRSLVSGTSARFAVVQPRQSLATAVIGLNSFALAGAAVLSGRYEVAGLFDEGGLIPAVNAVELLVAGALGLLAFRHFWRVEPVNASARERAGSFFWALSGAGLIMFAVDDFLSLHERTGRWVAEHVGTLPLLTNNVDDVITLAFGVAGLVALRLFRHELFAITAASSLYLAGVCASALMLIVDAYGRGPLTALEFPAHTTAAGLLLLAHVSYFLRARTQTAGSPLHREQLEPTYPAPGESGTSSPVAP
jgi:hypothetical protein